jgi:hypothetical protein
MSVSAVNAAQNSYWNTIQSKYNQPAQDFQGLSSAIQSGDLSTAQTALAAFQKDIQNNPQGPLATALSDSNSQISKDFQALQTALQSNDVSAAQTAFAAVKQDLKALHHHHHHHKAASDGDSTSSATDTTSTASTSATNLAVGVFLDEQA